MNELTHVFGSRNPSPAASRHRARRPPLSWRDAVPVLTGEHCVLRELERADAAQLLHILTAPDVCRFMSPPPASVERFTWFIDWSRGEREAGRYVALALVPHALGSAIGLLQLRQVEPEFRTAEWGIAIAPQYWGSGLFADASRLLLDFAFSEVGVHRLEARAALANARVQAAMQKLGAVQEGVLRRSLTTADGQRHDQVLWSILDDEWQRLNAEPDVVQVH
jgi:RimJ/RimL family protein N-acetyltransferase